MRAINLLPNDALGAERSGLPKALPIVAAAAVPAVALGLVITGYRGAHSVLAEKQRELVAVQAEVAKAQAAVPKQKTPAVDTSALIAQRTARLAALQTVLAKEIPWDTTMRVLSRVLPAGVWLTDLTLKSPQPADTPSVSGPQAGAPSTFQIDGYALDNEGVANLLARLQVVPALTDVTLTQAAASSIGTKPVVQFTIVAAIAPPVGATPPAPVVAPTTTTTPTGATP